MNMVAAGTVNAQGQVMIDTDVIKASLMAPQQGQSGGGVDVLAAMADAANLVGAGIRIERLRSQENRVARKREAVNAAQTATTAAIGNAVTQNKSASLTLPNGQLNPNDPTGAILLAIQAAQQTSMAQQDLSEAQEDLDEIQDEEADFTAASAGMKLADDLGAGSGGGMGGTATAALAGAAAGGAAGLLTSGSRSGRSRR